MNLVKLVDELREYRAQVEEAIVAMEQLARRRGSRVSEVAAVPSGATAHHPKKKRKSSKKKSR